MTGAAEFALTAARVARVVGAMNIEPGQLAFLREVVKASRQRTHHVTWVDRDGTSRLSALNSLEFGQVREAATAHKISPAEMLRQVAHIPNRS